jgi:hypothetical protein
MSSKWRLLLLAHLKIQSVYLFFVVINLRPRLHLLLPLFVLLHDYFALIQPLMNEVIYQCAALATTTVITTSAFHREVTLLVKLAKWVSIRLLLLLLLVVIYEG